MRTSENKVVFLILYVDDILLIGNHISTLQDVKSWLGKCFAMKDLGETTYILGIRIYRDRFKRLIGLSQSTYNDKILRRFSMQNSKREVLMMQKGIKLSKSQCPVTPNEIRQMEWIPYASPIGSIMYAMICTRLDVSLALSLTSRYQQNLSEEYWIAVKNILKYLRRTKDIVTPQPTAETSGRDDCSSHMITKMVIYLLNLFGLQIVTLHQKENQISIK